MSVSLSSTIPDRVTIEEGRPGYLAGVLTRQLRVFIDGVEQHHVVEFCISGGWARRHVMGPNGEPLRNIAGTGWKIERVTGKIQATWGRLPE